MRTFNPGLLSAITCSLLLALAACSTPTITRLHTLLQAGGSGLPAAPALVVALGPVTVPVQVDQPQWLVRQADGSLLALEQERWAAPLRDELRAALLQGLAAQAGAVEQNQSSAPPTWRIQVDVTQFESQAGVHATLEAVWTLAPVPAKAGAGITCATRLREAVAEGAPALAQGHARAVRALATQIAGALRARHAGQTSACT